MKTKAYEKELRKLQVELCHLQSWVKEKGCDLIAMSTHGHKFLADIFLGTTANRVQHAVSVPVLLLRAR